MIETEEIYVCAGICRMDIKTSTCIGCGCPLTENDEQVDASMKPPDQEGTDSRSKPDLVSETASGHH
jgi:hypothetical protein